MISSAQLVVRFLKRTRIVVAEQQLMENVVDFYWSVRRPDFGSHAAGLETVGAFKNTWTHAQPSAVG